MATALLSPWNNTFYGICLAAIWHLIQTLGASLIASSASCLPDGHQHFLWHLPAGPRVAALIPTASSRRGLVRTLGPSDPHLSARYRGQTWLCLASGSSVAGGPPNQVVLPLPPAGAVCNRPLGHSAGSRLGDASPLIGSFLPKMAH